MGRPVGLCHLSVQQDIAPAPDGSPKVVDWLPLFAGFSWLAYGTQCAVVITMAPSPSNTGEAAVGGFCRQVLSLDCQNADEQDLDHVTSVCWAPSGVSIGTLAAAAGKHIHVYAPKSFGDGASDRFPEIPLTWVKSQVLDHAFDIFSFSWSESGDGLLSVGPEIVMWHKEKQCWSRLWRFPMEQPQSLSAASWSARGIAASADAVCSTVTEKQEGDADHMVRIWWWWEDGKELQEIELLHPHHIVSIQWRPMRGFGSSTTAFRPVLLTCCRDGVVRLWAEIGDLGLAESLHTGRANLEPNVDSNDAGVNESQLKLAFFVSAVIDVNSALKGDLGKNIYVTWPEARGGGLKFAQGGRDQNGTQVNKESEEARNEWIIGIGPSGSVALWSVQSLDDLSPDRGPLIQLWHQRSGLLPVPSLSSSKSETVLEGERSLGAVKVVIHRPHGTFWGPPSSLDVFETWSRHLLRWSCVWPPVEAIGGHNSRTTALNRGSFSTSTTAGKLSAWGMSSEVVDLSGHSRNIVQIAVHPSAHVMLVASLDDHGHIILWDTSDSFFKPRLETTGSVSPQWRICGQLHDKRLNCTTLFNSVAWAPLALRGRDAILLTGSSAGMNCFLISKRISLSQGKTTSFSISSKLLLAFEWPLSVGGHGPTGLYTLASNVTFNHNSQIRSCIIVGVGDNEQKLASWKLDVELVKGSRERRDLDEGETGGQKKLNLKGGRSERAESGVEDPGHPDDTVMSIVEEATEMSPFSTKIRVSLLGFAELNTGQQVTSISIETSGSLGDSHGFCDVVTGCADGVVRLWKVWDGSPVKSANLVDNHVAWQCVGVVKVSSGPVVKVAFCGAASKLASVAHSFDEAEAVVQIWGVNILLEQIGFCLDGIVEVAPGPSISLNWFDGVIGLPVLGVASQFDIHLFSESRESKVELTEEAISASNSGTVWTTLASSPRKGCRTDVLSWDLQGNLIVTCGRHIYLYSDCVESMSFSSTTFSSLNTSKGVTGGSIRPQSFYELSDQKGMRKFAKSKALAKNVFGAGNETGLGSILETAETIGSPVLDYHPSSLMSWMCGGSREYARASVRHLASCLLSLSSFSSVENRNRDYSGDLKYVEPKVPHTPLNEVFQVKEQRSSLGQNFSWSLIPEGGAQINHLGVPENFSLSSSSSFVDASRDDATRGQSSIKAGGLKIFTKVEVEAITDAVRASVKIPGLSELEKLQLLSIIDVLAEMDGVTQASQVDSIDLPGQRLWLAVRYAFHFAKWKKEQNPDADVPTVESKVVAWALQSDSKETLCSLCIPDQAMTWPAMRAAGLGFWLTDGTELRMKMEKLARAQYLRTRDPKECALLYIALERRHVLSGLFKLSKEPKDKPLADFLLRDFKDEKHQGAALKNAYVLMGKHRYELAAAFFILGGDNNSAAFVCAKNLGDVQLALVICSLLEGVNGPIRRDILVKYALPNARSAGDVWLASLLQWLLGEGIQCIQELDCSNVLRSSPRHTALTVGALKGYPLFPLDPDVGKYCTLLVSKPRLRTESASARASDMARFAASQSAAALIKSGLYLQALDYVGSSKYANLGIGVGGESDHSQSTVGGLFPLPSEAPPANIMDLEVGSGWVSMATVAGLHSTLRLNLAIRCTSRFLQDHPHWGGRTSGAWLDPLITAVSSKHVETLGQVRRDSEDASKLDSSSDTVDHGLLEEADKSFATDMRVLQTKFNLKVDDIVTPSITLSQARYRPYLCHRLLQGLWSFLEAPDVGLHLASQSSVSELSARFLEISGVEAPRALARLVLSCGGGASAPASPDVQNLGTTPGRNIQSEKLYPAQADTSSSLLLEELVRFGGEILRLAKAASCKSPLFSKDKGSRAMNLLSFVFFVAAAWLGRQVETLHELISPTVTDPSTSPTVPPEERDAVLWFRRLDLVKASRRASTNIARGKRPLETGGLNIAGTVTISTDDAWRVLGVCLWTHLLIYVKKQLSGMASEAVYNSLGPIPFSQSQNFLKTSMKGVAPQHLPSSNTKGSTFLGFETATFSSSWLDFKSKVRESYHHAYHSVPESNYTQRVEGGLNMSKLSPDDERITSATDFDDFGAALLSAITSIVAGLRKQLAAHLGNTLERSEPDPLILWLWGKPSLTSVQYPTTGGSGTSSFFGASASSGQGRASSSSGGSSTSRGQSVVYPTVRIETQNVLWRELWEILVVREKVCSALGLEGVNGQRTDMQNGNVSGWYLGRKAHALTPQSSLDRSGGSMNVNGKRPPKRIMWNALQGVSPASDQGVILSSKRDEITLSRPRASKEGLPLSEEFSEWVDKRDHFR